MSSTTSLKAILRTEFGKGAARRTRRAGNIPAVIYGHGVDPIHVALPGHEAMMALKVANAVLQIDIDGAEGQLCLAKDVQRDPVKRVIEHVDLVIVRRGEKVQVEVPVHITGNAAPGSLVSVEMTTVLLEAEATHIPESIEIDVDGAEIGTQVHGGGLSLPEGVTYAGDAEQLVVNVTQAAQAPAEDEENAGGETETAETSEESSDN